jgi:protein tyrosine phosphatase (PTP) superfamily phosphohydrolase (DUF442 family)
MEFGMDDQQVEKKTSKLAYLSCFCFVFGLLGFPLGLVLESLVPISISRSLIIGAPVTLFIASGPLALISLVTIIKAKGKVKGRNLATTMLSIWLIVLALLAIQLRAAFKDMVCYNNMCGLSAAFNVYTFDYEGRLPVEKWCDQLITDCDVGPKSFICSYSNHIEGKESSYAMNINAAGKKRSELPDDLVLLFESKPGWNQVGGPELITLKFHRGKHIYVINVDGYGGFVRPDDIDQLRWTVDEEVVSVVSDRPGAWAVAVEKAGCGNLHKVSDVLYRGEQPTVEGFKELEKMGVKTVLNLRSLHSDRDELEGVSLGYEHVRMEAWEPELEEVREALEIMTDETKQPVFVHCLHGADRTGTVVAAYRVAVEGWNKEEAIKEMREGGFGFHEMWKGLPKFIRELDVAKLKGEMGI